MKKFLFTALILYLLFGAVVQAAVLQDFRIGVTPERTRVVFELDRWCPFQVMRSDVSVTVRFDSVIALPSAESKLNWIVGGLLRYGSFDIENLELNVRLGVAAPFQLRHLKLTNPDRLVIDIYPGEDVVPPTPSYPKLLFLSDIMVLEDIPPATFRTTDPLEIVEHFTAKPQSNEAMLLNEPIFVRKPLITFSIRPMLTYCFGSTAYTLDAKVTDPNSPSGYAMVRSELEFPLDAALAGLNLKIGSSYNSPRSWAFEAGFLINVNDPRSLMTNQDWIDTLQITYTESAPETRMTIFSGEVEYQIYRGFSTSLLVFAHLTYEKIKQDLVGYEGWSYNYIIDQPEPISGTEAVINYEITYIYPQLGIASIIDLSRFTALGLKTSAGLVFASDLDDHLLRGKLSEAEAVGLGLSADVKFSLLPGFALGNHLSLDLFGQFRYFHAEGNQTQRWYKDDFGIPAGTVIEDVPHEFESLQYSLGLQVGYTF